VSNVLIGISVALGVVAFLDSMEGPAESLSVSVYRIALYSASGFLSIGGIIWHIKEKRRDKK